MRFPIISFMMVLAITSIARADFIGASWLGPVYRINQLTGTAVQINTALPSMNSMAGPYQGKLYVAARNKLATLDPQSGALLGSITLPVNDIRAMAFSPSGELYASQNLDDSFPSHRALLKIDIHTGSATQLGILTAGIQAMTFSPDGTLYAWDVGASGNGDGFGLIKLATDGSGFTDVNPAVGTPEAAIQSIEFAPSGVSYGACNQLFTINIATGSWTPVGNQVFNWDVRGIAFVPEPSTAALLVIGSVVALFARRR